MGLNDTFFIIVCILMPAFIYCGKLTEFFLLQHRLLDLLRYRNSRLPYNAWVYRYGLTMPPSANFTLALAGTDTAPWTNTHPNKLWRPLMLEQRLPVSSSPVIYRHPPNTTSTSPLIRVQPLQAPAKAHSLLVFKRGDYEEVYKAAIEVLVVVDNSIFRKYLKQNGYDRERAREAIKQYYKILFALVDQRFETIADRLISVRVHICDIVMTEKRREAAWTERISKWSELDNNCVLSSSRALKRFQRWLKRNRRIPTYDHAVIFTSCLLNKRRVQVDGLAYVGTMCKVRAGKSASIVHDSGDFQAAGVVAHELGHSMGVSHDSAPENADCPASENYVMAPQFSGDDGVATNSFYFSSCSIRQMKTFLQSTQATCLFDKAEVALSHDLNRNPPGVIFDVNTQCKNAFGSSYSYCELKEPSAMCSQLWCTSTDDANLSCRRHRRLMALPGTACGHRRHCHLGHCVYSNRFLSPYYNNMFYNRIGTRTASCPRGDQNAAYCRGVIRASPYINPCDLVERLRVYCCDSCMTRSIMLWKR